MLGLLQRVRGLKFGSDRGKIVDTYASRNKKLIKNYFPVAAFCKPISRVQ